MLEHNLFLSYNKVSKMPTNQVEKSNTTIFTYAYLFMISSTCNFLLGVS